MSLRLLTICAVAMLAACGSNRHCIGEFPYQRAATLAPPAEVEGLSTPESVAALRIPPAPAESVPYARNVPDPEDPGSTRVQCLDVPPPMTIVPEADPAPAAAES